MMATKKTKKLQQTGSKNPFALIVKTWHRVVMRTPRNPHRAFRMTKRKMYLPTVGDVKSGWRLVVDSWRMVMRHKWVLLGLGALYAVLMFAFVNGIAQADYVMLKDATVQVLDGEVGTFGASLSLLGAALSGELSVAPSELQQFFSAVLTIFFWLAIVWAARLLMADKNITIRDALYNSGTPVVPTIAVMIAVVIQLIPAAVGIFAYSAALNGGWLTGGVESMVFAAAAVLLSLLSLYFVVSSFVALVIVTFPGMYPWQALKEARALVIGRRWNIALRVLVMMVLTALVWVGVLWPTLLLDAWLRFDWLPLVPFVIQALTGLTLVYASVYIYKLYRSLL